MTIALGVLASDGVLIAADTEETYGQIAKLEVNKVRLLTHRSQSGDTRRMLVAGAGTGPYIDALVQYLDRHVLPVGDNEFDPAKAVHRALRQFHKAHILPFAEFGDERPFVQLVIGYQAGSACRLFQTYLTTTLEQENIAVVGAGEISAKAVFGRYGPSSESGGPDDPFTLREAAFLATLAVWQAKDSVPGCGKRTEILAISSDGRPMCIEPHVQEAIDGIVETYGQAVPVIFWEVVQSKSSAHMDRWIELLRTSIGQLPAGRLFHNLED